MSMRRPRGFIATSHGRNFRHDTRDVYMMSRCAMWRCAQEQQHTAHNTNHSLGIEHIPGLALVGFLMMLPASLFYAPSHACTFFIYR
jgi:hypothetical protein